MNPAFSTISVLAAFALAPRVGAQTAVANRVDAVRDGRIVMHYATRADVCGSSEGDGVQTIGRRGTEVTSSGWTRDDRECVRGPAFVTVMRSGGETMNVRMRVGFRPNAEQGDVDLGDVPPVDAATFFIGLAPKLGGGNGDRALAAAAVADAPDAGRELLTLSETNSGVAMSTRKTALFWAGQSDLPAEQLVAANGSLHGEELRQHFTFVLSQRHESPALAALMDIAQHDDDREVRRQAIFWLGQSHDPKAKQFLLDLIMR